MPKRMFKEVLCIKSGDGYEENCVYPVVGYNNGVQIAREDDIFLAMTYVDGLIADDLQIGPQFRYISALDKDYNELDGIIANANDAIETLRKGKGLIEAMERCRELALEIAEVLRV